MTPVKFRCKRSGNTITMLSEIDIAELRKHESYEEIVNVEEETGQEAPKEVLNKRGRKPRTVEFPEFMKG